MNRTRDSDGSGTMHAIPESSPVAPARTDAVKTATVEENNS